MQIAMIGSGYVGLVSGACLADFGHTVVCIDNDEGKIDALKAGKMPIFEPGLQDLVATNVHQRRLSFSTGLEQAVAASQAVFIAVGTPSRRGDEVERIIRERRPEADFAVVSNPEFLREGAAIGDFKRPDRIIIGVEDKRGEPVMREIYRPLYLNQAPFVFTGRRTAELTKYAANAFL